MTLDIANVTDGLGARAFKRRLNLPQRHNFSHATEPRGMTPAFIMLVALVLLSSAANAWDYRDQPQPNS